LTADAIVQISSKLTALTHVHLAYTADACKDFVLGADELVHAAAAWAQLPLVSLSFGLMCCRHDNVDSSLTQSQSMHAAGYGAAAVAASAHCSDRFDADQDGQDGSIGSIHDDCDLSCDEVIAASGLMLQQLAQLTRLTSLRIVAYGKSADGPVVPLDAALDKLQPPTFKAAALAACLQQLTGLQSLHVVGRLVGGQQAIVQLQQAVQGLTSCSSCILPRQ
jgi:hypothetical protein